MPICGTAISDRLNLSGADLRGANMGGAKLTEANLTGASLCAAVATETDLRGALLFETNFTDADLRGSNLEVALLRRTIFGATNLTAAVGLSRCRHLAPSVLDTSTVLLSPGLPRVFLRGCGMLDTIIEFLPSLVNPPIQFYSCFISYSTADQTFAERVHADLQKNRVRSWLATEDLKIGDPFRQRIDESIRLHDKLLLILSNASIRSTWVASEVEAAFEKERRLSAGLVLFPLRLDDAIMDTNTAWAADIRRTRHIGDFCSWHEQASYQRAFARLLRDLRNEAVRESQGIDIRHSTPS